MTPITLKAIPCPKVYASTWLQLVTRGYACSTNKTKEGWHIEITERPPTKEALVCEMTKIQVKRNKALERQCIEAVHSNKSTEEMRDSIKLIFSLSRRVESLAEEVNACND